ncbi:MAG: flagellar motor stator protein MotA [Proteobacteria bacterium]|nr:flagellar motor stator protein MotA [Pseudomonadota bacterium]
MNLLIGFVVVMGCVLGGFVISGGHVLALWHPSELLVIFGAAMGAFIIANPIKVIKKVGQNFGFLFRGSKYSKQPYLDTLSLMYDLLNKARKDGMVALEADVDEPENSAIFQKYPAVTANHHALEFICDYLRMMVSAKLNAFEIEALMDVELDTHTEEGHTPAAAVTRVADALPGFGIVAAVLGIVVTMASLTEGPEVIGHKVATALVGTFLGILLAYGLVGPVATFLEFAARDESQFIKCLKTCLMASIHGYPPQIAIEFGRKAIFTTERPGFRELDEHIKNNKA